MNRLVRLARSARRPRPGRGALDRPVPRWAALAGLLGAALAVALLASAVGLLRHPAPSEPTAPVPPADPREETVCPASPRQAGPRGASPPLVGSDALLECPDLYDGIRVTYRGEAVGALLHRRAGVWLQLNDDVYAEDLGPLIAHQEFRGGNAGIGVLAPHGIASEITFVGGPRAHGDLVEVTGTFLRADPASREIAVIRADTARVLRPGEPIERPVLLDRQVAAYAAVLLALLLTVVERVARRRRARA